MPPAVRYIQSNAQTVEATKLEDEYRKERVTRQKMIEAAWSYYEGKHHQHLAEDGSMTNDNVVVNMYELAIDKAVSGLAGDVESGGENAGIKFTVEDERAQTYLDACWDANLRDILLHNLALNGGLAGQAFVKLVPEGRIDPDTGNPLPRVVNLDPQITTAFWQENDVERVLWYRVEYSKIREDYVKNDVAGWTIYTYRRDSDSAPWPEPVLTTWDAEYPPIVSWQNLPLPNRFYGERDIKTSGAGINDGVNFVLSNLQRIIKHHAHPKTVIVGSSADAIQPTAVDRLWAIPNENARVEQLELQSDLSSSLAFAAVLRSAFFDEAREVDPGSVADRLGQMTNFALRVLYQDTLNKIGTKRLLMAVALHQINRAILQLGGFQPMRVTIKWPQPLPVDAMGQAQALSIDREHGLSQTTYLERRGFDPQKEAAQSADEQSAGNVDLLATLAGMAQTGQLP